MLTLLSVIFFVLLILVLAYLFTRYVVGRRGQGLFSGDRKGYFTLLSQMALGKDRQLLLVQAGERYFLLGSTPNGLQNLAEVSREEIENWKNQESSESGGQTPSFRESLQTVLKQKMKR